MARQTAYLQPPNTTEKIVGGTIAIAAAAGVVGIATYLGAKQEQDHIFRETHASSAAYQAQIASYLKLVKDPPPELECATLTSFPSSDEFNEYAEREVKVFEHVKNPAVIRFMKSFKRLEAVTIALIRYKVALVPWRDTTDEGPTIVASPMELWAEIHDYAYRMAFDPSGFSFHPRGDSDKMLSAIQAAHEVDTLAEGLIEEVCAKENGESSDSIKKLGELVEFTIPVLKDIVKLSEENRSPFILFSDKDSARKISHEFLADAAYRATIRGATKQLIDLHQYKDADANEIESRVLDLIDVVSKSFHVNDLVDEIFKITI